MTAIIDYDAGNLRSVEKALQALGEETVITRDRDRILAADRVILPGVGAFGDAMEKLQQYGLDEIIRQVVQKGTPLLGICLGLQLLFEESEESRGVPGLGILKGKIRRIPDTPGLKIPHMGWNSLTIRPGTRLFSGLGEEPYVYFVHSYYVPVTAYCIATCDYQCSFAAAICKNNFYGCQFHPEKSAGAGEKIIKNFLDIV